jgi:hypothetical protein
MVFSEDCPTFFVPLDLKFTPGRELAANLKPRSLSFSIFPFLPSLNTVAPD